MWKLFHSRVAHPLHGGKPQLGVWALPLVIPGLSCYEGPAWVPSQQFTFSIVEQQVPASLLLWAQQKPFSVYCKHTPISVMNVLRHRIAMVKLILYSWGSSIEWWYSQELGCHLSSVVLGWKATVQPLLACSVRFMSYQWCLEGLRTQETVLILALGSKWSIIGQFTSFFILYRCVSSWGCYSISHKLGDFISYLFL